jgi:hypothetical protein
VIAARAKLVKPQVDSRMESQLRFPSGAEARVVCDMLSPRLFDSYLKVQGDAGEMTVISPFQPHLFHLITVRNAKGVTRGQIRARMPTSLNCEPSQTQSIQKHRSIRTRQTRSTT